MGGDRRGRLSERVVAQWSQRRRLSSEIEDADTQLSNVVRQFMSAMRALSDPVRRDVLASRASHRGQLALSVQCLLGCGLHSNRGKQLTLNRCQQRTGVIDQRIAGLDRSQ